MIQKKIRITRESFTFNNLESDLLNDNEDLELDDEILGRDFQFSLYIGLIYGEYCINRILSQPKLKNSLLKNFYKGRYLKKTFPCEIYCFKRIVINIKLKCINFFQI